MTYLYTIYNNSVYIRVVHVYTLSHAVCICVIERTVYNINVIRIRYKLYSRQPLSFIDDVAAASGHILRHQLVLQLA